MNRYPVWKYVVIVIALLVGALYTLPNFFGESPAVQVSSAKPAFKVDSATLARVEEALKAAGITADSVAIRISPSGNAFDFSNSSRIGSPGTPNGGCKPIATLPNSIASSRIPSRPAGAMSPGA